MVAIKIFLVVPALAAMAMPVVERGNALEAVHPDFFKRNIEVAKSVHPDFGKREDAAAESAHRDFSKRTDHEISNSRVVPQPKIPSFIDTGACLCGLLESRSTLPNNGGIIEMWRCMANLYQSIADGSHGKWFNTSLPSQDLSGIAQPRNWGFNPPNVKETFVLVYSNNNTVAEYLPLDSQTSSNLVGNDVKCTGNNDTAASTTFYKSQADLDN